MVASALAVRDVTTTPIVRRGNLRRSRLRHGAGVLAYSRLRRALRRQWPVLALCALTVGGIGAATWLSGAIAFVDALKLFAPSALLIGIALAAFIELSRNTVTSVQSLGKHESYAVLGAAPLLTRQLLRGLPPDQRSPLGNIVFMPASAYASAYREVEQALAQSHVVAFIAPVAGEGASTAALCTAVSAVQQGRSVILVDCDLRQRGFTSALEHEPRAGVLEACADPDNWRSFVDEEVETGLHFLPAARAHNAWATLAGSAGFPQLLDQLRQAYDLIVLDCAPALTSADGPFIARQADRSVLVASWDSTPIRSLRDSMRQLRIRSRASTAVLMNRVPPDYRYSRYELPS